jgi:hypothetical protein
VWNADNGDLDGDGIRDTWVRAGGWGCSRGALLAGTRTIADSDIALADTELDREIAAGHALGRP